MQQLKSWMNDLWPLLSSRSQELERRALTLCTPLTGDIKVCLQKSLRPFNSCLVWSPGWKKNLLPAMRITGCPVRQIVPAFAIRRLFDSPQSNWCVFLSVIFASLRMFCTFLRVEDEAKKWLVCVFKGKSAAEGGSKWGGLQCDHSVSGHLSLSWNNLSLELGRQDYHLWHRWDHHQVFKWVFLLLSNLNIQTANFSLADV